MSQIQSMQRNVSCTENTVVAGCGLAFIGVVVLVFTAVIATNTAINLRSAKAGKLHGAFFRKVPVHKLPAKIDSYRKVLRGCKSAGIAGGSMVGLGAVAVGSVAVKSKFS